MTCARLRARGYPAPVVVRTGRLGAVDYILSERLPGEPMRPTTIARVPQVLALVDAQRGIGLPEPIALGSGHGRQRRRRPRSATASTSRCRRTPTRRGHCSIAWCGSPTRPHDFDVPTDDIVHFDLSHANVLSVDGETITGVIDWEGTTTRRRGLRPRHPRALHLRVRRARRVARRRGRALRPMPRASRCMPRTWCCARSSWSLRNADDFTIRWWLDLGTALLDAVGAG